MLLESDPKVIEYFRNKSIGIPYVSDNKTCVYHPDFIVRKKNKVIEVVEVK
jgi:hypothetical protein